MGLDTTHDCWSGPYTRFHAWRKAIASAVGINLTDMVGFGGDIEWASLKPRAIHVLLDHSDCDGEIAVEHLIPLAEDLEAIAEGLPDGPWFAEGWARHAALRFAAGCRDAAAAGAPVEFH